MVLLFLYLYVDPTSDSTTAKDRIAVINNIQNDVTDLWYYIKSNLKDSQRICDNKIGRKLDSQDSNCTFMLMDYRHKFKHRLDTIHNSVLNLKEITESDVLLNKSLVELDKIVQQRLQYLQNPINCSNARTLLCPISKPCGFGCQIHGVIHCFIVAYATKRMLVLDSQGWDYSRGGWEKYFHPLSNNCQDLTYGGQYRTVLTINNYNDYNIQHMRMDQLNLLALVNNKLNFLAPAIPNDIANVLKHNHEFPFVWWIGQFVKYIFKLQPDMEEYLSQRILEINYNKPVVAIHVRRSDKVISGEASRHEIEEYMSYVDEHYEQLETVRKVPQRRIYLSTDDPTVHGQLISK